MSFLTGLFSFFPAAPEAQGSCQHPGLLSLLPGSRHLPHQLPGKIIISALIDNAVAIVQRSGLVDRSANNWTEYLPVFPNSTGQKSSAMPASPTFFDLHSRKNILRLWSSYFLNALLEALMNFDTTVSLNAPVSLDLPLSPGAPTYRKKKSSWRINPPARCDFRISSRGSS